MKVNGSRSKPLKKMKGGSEKGLMKINILLIRAGIHKVRDHYSARHMREAGLLTRAASAVKGALRKKQAEASARSLLAAQAKLKGGGK